MRVKYTVRMQFGPHQDSHTVLNEILDVCRKGRVDEVMFFTYAEEQNDGHDTIQRVREWMAAIRPWKKALEARGVEVSLNPWHSVLHCDRNRRLKPGQHWQNMVDWKGAVASAVVCPLDPDWRAYFVELLRIFAAERFRVLWLDDDIRYHNHEPLEWGGCWCPLHMAEFSRRIGRNVSRDELVTAALQPGTPHPWRAAWFDMWDELHCELIDSWREILEPMETRLGLMSSVPDIHATEGRRWDRWWPALAKRFSPVNRPHFWGYDEGPSSSIIRGISLMQMNRMVQPDSVESDPEIENFPYGPWNKSFRQTAAQMALAQVFGSDRLAVSLYDFMGNMPSDDPERAEFLARVKPMLGWLGDQFPLTLTSVGLGVPWHPNMSRTIHTDGLPRDWWSLRVDPCGWDHWFGAFGFAFQKRPHEHVNALAGPMAYGFDDAILRQWLTKTLLLDGPAAAILANRGFGDLIGLSDPRFITQADALYSMEESLDDEFGLRPYAQMSLNAHKPYKDRLLQGQLKPGTRIISRLLNPLNQPVGHGAYIYENSAGGRVAVMPWDATAGTNLCTQRRAQIAKVLAWISRGTSCAAVEGAAWLIPQFLTDGNQWRGVVWNAGSDAVRSFRVTLPEGMGPIACVVQCSMDGIVCDACASDNEIALPKPLYQWDFVVLNPDPAIAIHSAGGA